MEDGKISTELIGQTDETGKIIKVDLDREVLKPLAGTGKLYAYDSPEYCKDMGTPERFKSVSNDLTSGLVSSRNLRHPQKAIFLDRDGCINRYNGFIISPEQFSLLPGASEAIRLINSSGCPAIIITNQPVIARGDVTVEELTLIHNKMETLLGAEGAYIDAIYYCPHHPDKGFAGEISSLKFDCDCRKPKPGMLLQAADDYNIELGSSWMIGDGWRDIECGINAGTRTVLLNGEGTESASLDGSKMVDCERQTEFTAPDLLTAVKMILNL